MRLKALENNTTLKITKGNVYEGWRLRDTTLLRVANDLEDEVIMSIYNFEEEKSNF